MAEAEVRFRVPIGLKEEMEKFPVVEWSEIANLQMKMRYD